MNVRKAVVEDLPQLKAVYREIVRDMEYRQLRIWDEVYPCICFGEDIARGALYVLADGGEILAGFALCGTNPGGQAVRWRDTQGRALYLDRLGVSPAHAGKGIGSFLLEQAKELARRAGAESLRLFVVEQNEPAIRLYRKNGFTRAEGIYEEAVDETLTLREYGFEAALQRPDASSGRG